jgi:hypothetical protein
MVYLKPFPGGTDDPVEEIEDNREGHDCEKIGRCIR